MTAHASPARFRLGAFAMLAVGLCLAGCGRQTKKSVERQPQLAATRIDLAKTRLTANGPDETLALLVSAIHADPESPEAREAATQLLASTRWHLPETTIQHPLPVGQIRFAPPQTLWVSLSGNLDTTVKWNLDTLRIENVLFPLPETQTRNLLLDPTHRFAVVERAGIHLLCNAQSLKPIREIGPLPDHVNVSSTTVFSPNGLLLAHPAFVSPTDRSLVWHIRDSQSGEIIRSSDPIPAASPKPLAASLNLKNLHVLHADGSTLDMPVSPVEDMVSTPPAEPMELSCALFADDGQSALTLRRVNGRLDPQPFMLPPGVDHHSSLEPLAMLARFPWSRHPGIWTDMLQAPGLSPIRVSDHNVFFTCGNLAPVHTSTEVTAIAWNPDRMVTGDISGSLTIHCLLPVPHPVANPPAPAAFDDAALAAFRNLSAALSGLVYQDDSRTCTPCPVRERLEAFKACDFTAMSRVFPSLDFTPAIDALKSFTQRPAPSDALDSLTERLARASDKSGHQELGKAFEQADAEAVLSAIKAAGNNGSAAAKALELALASTHPEWIEACLQNAQDLPPLLRKTATSRIAWLQDRKADAIEGWPDEFPDLHMIRLREDWDGWENADFSQALEKIRLCVSDELDKLVIPDNPTPAQRAEVIKRLSDPATLKTIGRTRFAHACLKAATTLSALKEDSETTVKLATTARQLGEAVTPCLRAEALALTNLRDYQNARDRWVSLITDQPVNEHIPGDYAEAAYVAFENSDPRQAMAILTTGLHRFPNDADFALRAGWIALLAGNPGQAYRYLLAGRETGFPAEKLEKATAMLAIAAAQSGSIEDADVLYQELMRLDPSWKSAKAIDALDWPDEFKATLRQLVP